MNCINYRYIYRLTQYIERRKLQRQQARQSMASYKTQNALTDIKVYIYIYINI